MPFGDPSLIDTSLESRASTFENPTGAKGAGGAAGVAERVDDVCAASFTYCHEPQPVPPVDVALAVQHVERLPFETPSPFEAMSAPLA